MVDEKEQDQDIGATGPSTDLSANNQPKGTTRVENGIAYDASGKALGPGNEEPGKAAQSSGAFDFKFGGQGAAASSQVAQPQAAQPSGTFDFKFGKHQPQAEAIAAPQGGTTIGARREESPAIVFPTPLGAVSLPTGFMSRVHAWLEDAQSDVKNGTEATIFGAALRKMGAKGTRYGVSEGAGEFMAGPLEGIPKALEAVPLATEGHPVQAVNKALGGTFQSLGPVGAVAAPEGEALAVVVPSMVAAHVGSEAVKKMGLDEDYQELAGNVSAILAGAKVHSKLELERFEGAVQTAANAETAYRGRASELEVARQQAEHAEQLAKTAAQAEIDGKGTKAQTDAARTSASEARANATKAQKAFNIATEEREQARVATQKFGKHIIRKGLKAETDRLERAKTQTQDALTKMQKAIPARGTDFYQIDPETGSSDYDIVRGHLEAAKESGRKISTILDARNAAEDARLGIEAKIKPYLDKYADEPLVTDPAQSPKNIVQAKLDEMASVDGNFSDAMDHLSDFNITDMTVSEGQDLLTKLNDYMRSTKKSSNNWDIYNQIETNPKFAAMWFMAEAVRDKLYDRLEAHGVENAREGRYETKALVNFRNMADAQIRRNAAGTTVRGSGERVSPLRRVVSKLVGEGIRKTGVYKGAAVAGPLGAVVGGELAGMVAEPVEDFISPSDMTRDQHIAESMKVRGTKYKPVEIGGEGTEAQVPGYEPPPVPKAAKEEGPEPLELTKREHTDLHADLASYYDLTNLKNAPPYHELETRFRSDYQNKADNGGEFTSEEKKLMNSILKADAADEAIRAKAEEKADAAAKTPTEGKPGEKGEGKLLTKEEEGVKVPPERTTGKPEVDEAIKAGGGVPGGTMKGDEKIGLPELALFHDLESGTTLALKTAEGVTPEKVKARLEESRAQYAAAKKIKEVVPESEEDEEEEGGEGTTMREYRSDLRHPYEVAVQMPDGTTKIQSVMAYSFKTALSQVKKALPEGARITSVMRGEIPAEDLTYRVPNRPLGSMPPALSGKTAEQTLYHELGHFVIGARDGMPSDGILRHTHPDLRRGGGRAAVRWNIDPSRPESPYTADGMRIKPERLDTFLESLAGGIAADEVFNGRNRADNVNFTRGKGSSDSGLMLKYMRRAGVAEEDLVPMMHAAIDRAKEYLQNEHVASVIRENAGVRESGLSSQFHYSAQRLKSLHAEIQRRMGINDETKPAGPVQGDNGTVGGPNVGGAGQALPGAERAGPTEPVQAIPAAQGSENAAYNQQIDQIAETLRQELAKGPRGMNSAKIEESLQKIRDIRQKLMAADSDQDKGLISTRQPSGRKSTEDALRDNLSIGREAINNAPGMLEKAAKRIKTYVGAGIPKELRGNPAALVNHFTNHLRDNLIDMYNRVDPAKREATAKWYDSANKFAQNMATKYNSSLQQISGVIAAMSPQKDWDQNVSLAERVADTHFNHQDTVATPSMMERGKFLAKKRNSKGKLTNPSMKSVLPKIAGKALREIEDPVAKAAWVRLHDETTRPREYNKIDPGTGEKLGTVLSDKGEPRGVSWGGLNEISKALSILEDGSRENISDSLGEAHKVRNFYNNILDPNNPAGHVTIDTHAVAAAHQQPFSGKSPEVKFNFGGIGSRVTGAKGLYGIYADAYRQAASQLGIQPRQLQSIVWEHVRETFPDRFKRAAGGDHVNEIKRIWRRYDQGKATLPETRKAVFDYAEKNVAEMKAPTPEQELGVDNDEPK